MIENEHSPSKTSASMIGAPGLFGLISTSSSFVYCWTDHLTQKLYIGSHKGSLDDGYICSCKGMIEEYNKRPEDFTRQIIAEGSYKDCLSLETKILHTVDAKNNSQFYNSHNGDGDFYLEKHTEDTKQKHKKIRLQPVYKENQRQKSKKLWDNLDFRNKNLSARKYYNTEEYKIKQRLSHIGQVPPATAHNPEANQKRSSSVISLWKDPVYRDKQIKSRTGKKR